MNFDDYQAALKDASKMRLRAKSLLAEDYTNAFDAAVLLHAAERSIRRAQSVLDPAAGSELIRLQGERAWCLLEGFDPIGSIRIRDGLKVLATPEAMELLKLATNRLDAALRPAIQEHRNMLLSARTLMSAASRNRILPNDEQLPKARLEAAMLAAAYPGTVGYWWVYYRVLDALNEKRAAWEALRNAERLEPEHANVFSAIMVLLAPEVFDTSDARSYLDEVAKGLDTQPVEVLLHYAFAELKLDQTSRNSSFLQRARLATTIGEQRTDIGKWTRYFRVARRMIDARASGERLTVNVLSEEGLGHLIPPGKDPEPDLLTLIAAAAKPTFSPYLYAAA